MATPSEVERKWAQAKVKALARMALQTQAREVLVKARVDLRHLREMGKRLPR